MNEATAKNKSKPNVSDGTYLESYLDYYLNKTPPTHSVLVIGDYGVGKTHRVEDYFKRNSSPNHTIVSLFGRTEIGEIRDEVLAQAAPLRSGLSVIERNVQKEISRQGGLFAISEAVYRTAKGILKPVIIFVKKQWYEWKKKSAFQLPKNGAWASAMSVPNVARGILERATSLNTVLVFDDVDRCTVPHKDLLGLFNQYLEHQQCHVILIAHSDHLSDDFLEQEEKVVGQRFRIGPQTDAAMDAFIQSSVTDSAYAIVNSHRGRIRTLFEESELESLRILRQCIEDISRLVSLLDREIRLNETALSEVISLFCALSLEVRGGNLREPDLHNRSQASILAGIRKRQANEDNPLPPIHSRNKHYTDIDLSDSLLSDDVLVQTLINGSYEAKKINEAILASHHFTDINSWPAWSVLMELDRLPASTLVDAATRLEHEFENRTNMQIGPMLHSFAWRFTLARMGWLKKNPETIIIECQLYIDEILVEDQFEIPMKQGLNRLLEAYAHTSYFVLNEDKDNFSIIKKYLNMKVAEVREALVKEESQALIATLDTAPIEFRNQLCRATTNDGIFVEQPVLQYLNAEEFAQKLASVLSEHSDALTICYAIRERLREASRANSPTAKEHEWLDKMLRYFSAHIDTLSPIHRFKLQRKLSLIREL